MELRLPADRLTKALALVNRMANCRKVILRDVLSLTGLLSYCCLVVSAGRSFLRRLINLASGLTLLHRYITLNCEARPICILGRFLFNRSMERVGSMFLEQRVLSSHMRPVMSVLL